MKKAKLLSMVLSGILAVSAMSGAVVNADELYDVPDYITTLSELKESITEPVTISAEDYVKLSGYSEEKLTELYESGGIDGEQVSNLVKLYYEGLEEILELGYTHTIYPKDYDSGSRPITSTPVEYLTETSGTFESGVTYFYNEETKGFIFDGNGELSSKDFCRATSSFPTDFVFFGKDVTVECEIGVHSTILLQTKVADDILPDTGRSLIPFFTYENSAFTKQFDAYVDEMIEKGGNEDDYVYYTVEDGTNPETFVNPLEPIDNYVKISESGLIGNSDSCLEMIQWHYTGTKAAGGSLLFIIPVEANPFELEEMLEVSDKFNVTNVDIAFYSEPDMSCLPTELQGFETIEEVNNALLKAIETRKESVEQVVEETTEAVEEETIETVAEPVEILADEATPSDAPATDRISVRDCAVIASAVAKGNVSELEEDFDFNDDGKINVRDAAAIASYLADK